MQFKALAQLLIVTNLVVWLVRKRDDLFLLWVRYFMKHETGAVFMALAELFNYTAALL